MFDIGGQLSLQGAEPGRPMTAQTIMDINNLQLPHPGTYAFEVFLDGHHTRSVAIHAFKSG
jgi:hypothetical protein